MNGVVNGVAPQTGVLSTGLAAASPAPPPQALTTNGYVNGNGIGPLKVIANARAGTAGVRPRPIKKQKMVSCSSFLLVIPFWNWVVLLESLSMVVNG